MPDDITLSDTQAADRLQSAHIMLGEAPGATILGNTALEAARKALSLLTLGLIAAVERRDQLSDPLPPLPLDFRPPD